MKLIPTIQLLYLAHWGHRLHVDNSFFELSHKNFIHDKHLYSATSLLCRARSILLIENVSAWFFRMRKNLSSLRQSEENNWLTFFVFVCVYRKEIHWSVTFYASNLLIPSNNLHIFIFRGAFFLCFDVGAFNFLQLTSWIDFSTFILFKAKGKSIQQQNGEESQNRQNIQYPKIPFFGIVTGMRIGLISMRKYVGVSLANRFLLWITILKHIINSYSGNVRLLEISLCYNLIVTQLVLFILDICGK